jgi:hypothetical protein
VTIGRGQPWCYCPTCNAEVQRTRESRPPYENAPNERRQLFDRALNRLPFAWISWMSLRNLYRFAARRSMDTASLVLAILTVGIPVRVWREDRLVDAALLRSGIFVGISAAWILGFVLMLLARGARGQLGEVLLDEHGPQRRSVGALVLRAPRPWKIMGARRDWRRAYVRRLRRYFARLSLYLETSLSRVPILRIVPYLLSVLGVALAAGALLSGRVGAKTIAALGTIDILLFLLTLFYWMCKTAYDRVPPEEYASLVLGGRKAEEIFRWIAWEMYDVCSNFLDINTRLEAAQDELREKLASLPEDPLPNRVIMARLAQRWRKRDRDIDRLERRLLGQRMIIRRCAAMKTLAASEFGIHHRRLCDHVFRFSPTIFERRVSKYVRNWRVIARSIEGQQSHIPMSRLIDLIQENDRIVKRIRRRANYLRLIVGSKGIFEDVRVFASTASLGESLAAYASVVTRLATDAGHSELRQTAQLISVYMMRQAHPGIDLHRALTQLCRGGAPWCGERIAELSARAEYLRARMDGDGDPRWDKRRLIADQKREDLERHAAMWRDCTRVLEAIARHGGHSSDPVASLDVLSNLDTLVSAATHNTQWEINRNVEKELLQWLRNRPNVLIMTYGNSRVVRDVLKCVVLPLLEHTTSETHADTIFIARTDADEFESRMMAFSLREDRRWYTPGTTAELGYGDDTLLLSLIKDLSHDDLSVMILLGAESFDRDGRIVQIASAFKQIVRLKKKLARFNRNDPERVRFVAVAESYKECANLTRDTGFYREHLDQVALYPKGIIDLIISNNKRYPEGRPL